MRSALYSLFTTLLLLVPITAVPLMAVFGVPQFAPVVTSPLDEVVEEDDEDWNRPRKQKSRGSAARHDSDQDLEIADDESWNWDDAPRKRRSPVNKKSKPLPVTTDEEALPPELAEILAGKSSPQRKPKSSGTKKRAPQPLPEETTDGDNGIRLISDTSEETDDERPFVQTADSSEEVDAPVKKPKKQSATAPGYRRQQPGELDAADSNRDKKGSPKNKRSPPPVDSLTWKKAVDRLNELGIRNFRLEPGVHPGEFTFTCSYTPSHSPHVSRKFEAEADDPLKAVSQVLSQVERWAKQREVDAPQRVGAPAGQDSK